MTSLNPYAPQLGNRDPLEVIGATAGQLSSFVSTLGASGIETSIAPGKWSARQILCHLADCELVFAYRLRQALAENHHVIQPFDQDKWAENYAAYDAPAALAVFSSLRKWNLEFIRKVPPKAMSKPVTHPERGEMQFHVLIETMGGHDLNHIKQLQTIVAGAAAR